MSHEYRENERYQEEDRHYHKERREHKKNIFGEILGEIPIFGELFESIGGGRMGKKGMKKFCCCCAPAGLVLLIPAIILIYWIVKSGLGLFNINLSNVNWLGQAKSWFAGTFGLDQIGQWLNPMQGLLGL